MLEIVFRINLILYERISIVINILSNFSSMYQILKNTEGFPMPCVSLFLFAY